MTQTTVDQRVVMTGYSRGLSSGPVKAGITIPHGTMVFIDATNGMITNTDDGGANLFAGICHARADNSEGASGGEVDVEYYAHNNSFELPFNTTCTQAAVGDPVYAQDNWGCSLTATSATRIGTLEKFISATKGLVRTEFASADAVV